MKRLILIACLTVSVGALVFLLVRGRQSPSGRNTTASPAHIEPQGLSENGLSAKSQVLDELAGEVDGFGEKLSKLSLQSPPNYGSTPSFKLYEAARVDASGLDPVDAMLRMARGVKAGWIVHSRVLNTGSEPVADAAMLQLEAILELYRSHLQTVAMRRMEVISRDMNDLYQRGLLTPLDPESPAIQQAIQDHAVSLSAGYRQQFESFNLKLQLSSMGYSFLTVAGKPHLYRRSNTPSWIDASDYEAFRSRELAMTVIQWARSVGLIDESRTQDLLERAAGA